MATIEQMYNMLNKMKENVTQPVNNNESEGLGLELNKELIQLKNTMYGLTAELATCTDIIKQQSFNIHLLIEKVTKLELTLLKDRPKCIVDLDLDLDLELEAPFTYKSKTLGVRYERLEEPSISHTINDKKEIVVKVEEQHIKLNVEEQDEELEQEEEKQKEEQEEEKQEEEQEEEQDEEQEEQKDEEQEQEEGQG